MDYYDSFPTPPVRYAFDDDDESEMEEQEQQQQATQSSCSVVARLSQAIPSEHKVTLLLGVHGPGSVLLEALHDTTSIGELVTAYPEDDKRTSTTTPILQLPSDTTTLVGIPFQHTVPREDAATFVRSIMTLFQNQIESVYVLDAFARTNYISAVREDDASPPLLRVLQTSATQAQHFEEYQPPNMVEAFTAAALAYCEIHHVPCYGFLSLQETYLGKPIVTSETLEAYTHGFQALNINIAYDLSKMEAAAKKQQIDQHHHRLYL
ncbi:hypothetical protein BCR43DRAFT_488881 [Syncephalastrum racemosum]|uniref:Uncharacterized protein n=1 Tax=Syncephalastrum racemosum TaxID=13706 RepID=A0A1X2HJB1_SYNRA|nr:hypothetical protein BCR43DRAFT_488881 [Syncephalastrum racemosum]